MCVFLIIAFVYCDIVERVPYYQNRQVFTQIPVRQLQRTQNLVKHLRRSFW